jgi:hypothetical protein
MRQSLWAIAAALMISTASAKPVVEVPSVPPEQLSTMGTRVELRHLLDGQEIAEAPAIAWLGHHDGQLLVELHVSGRNQAPIADRDTLRIFEGPAVEVFLSVMEEPGHGYYHIATNPRAAIYDEFVRDAGWNRNVRWDMPATATLVPSEADSWAVRLEIPLAVLRRRVPEDAPVTTLDQEISLQLGTAAVLADGRNLAVAWSPTNTTFHTPSDFGRLRLLDPIPQFNARVEGSLEMAGEEVRVTASESGELQGDRSVEILLRLEEGAEPLVSVTTGTSPTKIEELAESVPLLSTGKVHSMVTRLMDANGVLVDQHVTAWPYREMPPVVAIHERFHDTLPLRLHTSAAKPLQHIEIRTTGENPRIVWKSAGQPTSGDIDIDASTWSSGVYRLVWQVGDQVSTTHIARLPEPFHFGPDEWAFWGYAPDEELLAEFATFHEMTGADIPITGLIYGGSIDPETGAMSAFNLESMNAWQRALPGAKLHLMIDGWGNFDLLTDDQVEHITTRLVDELMNEDIVAGIHFDLEPYRPSQIRITRALTRKGWTKGLSMATALATTIPLEQWASLDFMVAMNYDLGRTPDVFQRRAAQNARAFVETARDARRQVLIGIPVIATHHEYGLEVEAATGNITQGDRDSTMLPFVIPAMEIVGELRDDPELGHFVGPPTLWGALARGHHVGQRRYRYFPTTITGDVWGHLLEFDRERAAP